MENEKKINEIKDEELKKISGGDISEEDRKVLEKIRIHGSYRMRKSRSYCAYVKDIFPSGVVSYDDILYDFSLYLRNKYIVMYNNVQLSLEDFVRNFDIDNEMTNVPWSK